MENMTEKPKTIDEYVQEGFRLHWHTRYAGAETNFKSTYGEIYMKEHKAIFYNPETKEVKELGKLWQKSIIN